MVSYLVLPDILVIDVADALAVNPVPAKAAEAKKMLDNTAVILLKRVAVFRFTVLPLIEVVPEKLRTLDHGRPWSDDQFASTRLSSSRDMSR